jgi:hypothetical protein
MAAVTRWRLLQDGRYYKMAAVTRWRLLQDGGAPEYMYRDRTAWSCAFFVGKKINGSKG